MIQLITPRGVWHCEAGGSKIAAARKCAVAVAWGALSLLWALGLVCLSLLTGPARLVRRWITTMGYSMPLGELSHVLVALLAVETCRGPSRSTQSVGCMDLDTHLMHTDPLHIGRVQHLAIKPMQRPPTANR